MSGFRTPEIPREQLVLWERRLEDALPNDHQVRHLDFLLNSDAFAGTLREMERSYMLNRGQPPYHPRRPGGLGGGPDVRAVEPGLSHRPRLQLRL